MQRGGAKELQQVFLERGGDSGSRRQWSSGRSGDPLEPKPGKLNQICGF